MHAAHASWCLLLYTKGHDSCENSMIQQPAAQRTPITRAHGLAHDCRESARARLRPRTTLENVGARDDVNTGDSSNGSHPAKKSRMGQIGVGLASVTTREKAARLSVRPRERLIRRLLPAEDHQTQCTQAQQRQRARLGNVINVEALQTEQVRRGSNSTGKGRRIKQQGFAGRNSST